MQRYRHALYTVTEAEAQAHYCIANNSFSSLKKMGDTTLFIHAAYSRAEFASDADCNDYIIRSLFHARIW